MFKPRSLSSSSVRALALAVATVPLLVGGSSRGDTVRIAMTGEAAPGGGTFTDFGPFPVINSAGQVGFDAFVGGVGLGVYRSDFGGLSVPIARAGDAAPNGGTYSSASFPLTAGTSQVVFFGTVGRRGIFRSDGLSSVEIVLEGGRAPGGGEFSHIPGAVVNEGGGVAFHALTTTVGGVFYGTGETLQAFARGGDKAPGTGGGTFDGSFFTVHDVNAGGFVSFQAETPTGSGIFRGEGPGKVAAIARIGDAAPGGGTFFGFNGSRINASGRVAFFASRDAGSSLRLGLYHGTGAGNTVVVAEQGGAAPGGGNFVQIASSSEIAFNDANQIAFHASTTTTDGVFRGDATTLVALAREDEPAPDGNGRFAAFGLPSIARGGQVFFPTTLRGTAGGVNDDTAFILTDGIDRVTVAREGQFRDGSTLATFEVTPGERGGAKALNDHGQVVYGATLADGRQGMYVFTPDLHWRSRESGAWQTDGAWSLSLRPDAPHAVFIDPAFDLAVMGPSSRTTIRRLDVGSPLSNAKATLDLSAGGELAVSDTVTVHSEGVIDLRDGLLTAANLHNDGVMLVDGGALNATTFLNRSVLVHRRGTIAGYFVNDGTLEVDGHLSHWIDNRGKIVINSGGTLDAGAGMGNSGIITLKSGTWSASGPLSNNGTLRGNGLIGGTAPLTNLGLISVSGGSLVSTGGITNQGAVELSQTGSLHMGGGALDNPGTVSLNGGLLTGSIENRPGGVVIGPGSLGTMTANQGTLLVPHGTLNLFSAMTNEGVVQVRGGSAALTGGAITNNRTIEGAGRIANAITNNGTIEAIGGTLTLAGAVNNTASGLLTVPAGAKLLLPASPAANAGTIALTGGTFDTDRAALVNAPTALISGSGTLRTGGLQNSGTLGFSGGDSHVIGSVGNEAGGKVIVSGNGRATFHGAVDNKASAELRVSDGAVAVFFGAVTNDGTITGGGDKFFEGGISNVGALATTTGTSAVAEPATLFASHVRERSLSVRGKVVITPNGTASGTSVVDSLDIRGEGVFDLSDNDLVVRATAATRLQRLREVEGYVAAARNGDAGRWKGAGLTSSAAAADPLMTLAVGTSGGDDDDDDDDVIARYTYNGDANLDGRVNADDYFRIDQGFLAQPNDPLFAQGDFNYDGRVNADDYFLIDQAFLGQGAQLDGGYSSPLLASAVPEPHVAWLLLPLAMTASRRLRRTTARAE